MILVETDDAVLVIPRERAQDVRAVVEALQKRGETRLL
jgi:mannose-1-phosphate guanylyltransferase